MDRNETELEMVRRHVRQGAAHIARQRQLLAEFRSNGSPTDLADKVLAGFQDMQIEHEAHLERLTNMLAAKAQVRSGNLAS